MPIDRKLMASSSDMLVLKLLDGEDMYGYQMIEQLRELADEEYRTFNESLTPGIEGKSLGVRMPALRKVAKQILTKKEDAESCVL